MGKIISKLWLFASKQAAATVGNAMSCPMRRSESKFSITNRKQKCLRLLAETAIVMCFAIAVFVPPEALSAQVVIEAGHSDDHNAVFEKSTGSKRYVAVGADYPLPDVTLTDAEGKPVRLKEVLAQPRPILLQFIFTSCSTICPLLSATFSQFQRELDRQKIDYQLISISIDPEYDAAERLAAYAKRHHAGPRWMFLTGQEKDIHRVLTAFDALYQSDNKMYHRPLYYLRARPNTAWLRIEGFISVADLLSQLHSALNPG